MKIERRQNRTRVVSLVLATCLATIGVQDADAVGRGGGHMQHGGGGNMTRGPHGGGGAQLNNAPADARTRNVRNTSVNSVNRNVNVNANRNVNVNVDHHGGWDDDYHPVATAAAVTATVAVASAVVGSIVRSIPPNCASVNYGGMVYQRCGGTWYQSQGTQYIVVNPPY